MNREQAILKLPAGTEVPVFLFDEPVFWVIVGLSWAAMIFFIWRKYDRK